MVLTFYNAKSTIEPFKKDGLNVNRTLPEGNFEQPVYIFIHVLRQIKELGINF